MEAKQDIYRSNVLQMNLKIKELNNKKMSWGDYRLLKKYECIKLFNNVQMKHCGAQHINAKSTAYSIVSKQYDVSDNTIRRYLKEYASNEYLHRSLQGHFAKIKCGLDTAELKVAFKAHVESKIKTKKHFTARHLLPWINGTLLAHRVRERGKYAERTILLWLLESGFTFGKHQKSMYIDGHERPDVISVCVYI
eukprot:797810_1